MRDDRPPAGATHDLGWVKKARETWSTAHARLSPSVLTSPGRMMSGGAAGHSTPSRRDCVQSSSSCCDWLVSSTTFVSLLASLPRGQKLDTCMYSAVCMQSRAALVECTAMKRRHTNTEAHSTRWRWTREDDRKRNRNAAENPLRLRPTR